MKEKPGQELNYNTGNSVFKFDFENDISYKHNLAAEQKLVSIIFNLLFIALGVLLAFILLAFVNLDFLQ